MWEGRAWWRWRGPRSWNEREPRCHEVSPSSAGSRKDPDRIIPLGLSARDKVLPIWEPLYSSKAASWVGMLLERVILGVVAAEGLTRRTEGGGQGRGGGQKRQEGHQHPRPSGARRVWEGRRGGEAGRGGVPAAGAALGSLLGKGPGVGN